MAIYFCAYHRNYDISILMIVPNNKFLAFQLSVYYFFLKNKNCKGLGDSYCVLYIIRKWQVKVIMECTVVLILHWSIVPFIAVMFNNSIHYIFWKSLSILRLCQWKHNEIITAWHKAGSEVHKLIFEHLTFTSTFYNER